jgi:predicted Zn-dependent peptidase
MKLHEIYDPKMGEKLYSVKHPSGLKVFIYPKKDYTKKFAYFATKYGALYNRFQDQDGEIVELPLGVAHFLEHKIFEDEDRDIFSDFAKLGANVNAYTNFASTVYYFSTVARFDEALKLLLDFVLSPHITDENVEKEKGIIVQEIKMYDDDPNWRVYFNGLRAMYHNHPISQDIAGSVESVNSTTVDDLMKAYNTFYSPNNMVVFLIGDVDPEEIAEQIMSDLPEKFLEKEEMGTLLIEEEPKTVISDTASLEMGVPTPLFNFFIKQESAVLDQYYFRKALVNRIALDHTFGKGSEFYNTYYAEGLINSSFGYEYSYGDNYSYFSFGGESIDSEKVRDLILERLDWFKSEGIDSKSFTRIKRKMIGRYISSFNSIQYTANTFINYHLKGIDVFDFLSIIDGITEEDVNRAFDMELKNRMTLSKVI